MRPRLAVCHCAADWQPCISQKEILCKSQSSTSRHDYTQKPRQRHSDSMFFNCIDPYSPRHLPFDHNSLVQPRELAACRILLWSTPQPSAEPCHVLNLMHTDWGVGSQVGSYTVQKLREARGAVRTLDFGPEGRAGGWISMLKRLAS